MTGRLVARVRLQALLRVCLAGLWVAGSLAGCTNVRPTIKIGVLAPFEGLHRRSGYAALEAVRAAIVDFSNGDAGILPLALDDGDQPQQAVRSAQKLLADPRVAAVVGPLSPDLGAAVEPLGSTASIAWYPPYSVAGQDWATGLVRTAADLGAEARCTGACTRRLDAGMAAAEYAAMDRSCRRTGALRRRTLRRRRQRGCVLDGQRRRWRSVPCAIARSAAGGHFCPRTTGGRPRLCRATAWNPPGARSSLLDNLDRYGLYCVGSEPFEPFAKCLLDLSCCSCRPASGNYAQPECTAIVVGCSTVAL